MVRAFIRITHSNVPHARSAGIVLYRRRGERLEVLLVHPGGPFWARKDDGAWSIPKGEFAPDEMPAVAARREFAEEIGVAMEGELLPLTPVAQSRAKVVYPFAIEGDLDPSQVKSNTVTMEWPPRSGKLKSFPEIDRAAWFDLDQARRKILSGQRNILDQLDEKVRRPPQR